MSDALPIVEQQRSELPAAKPEQRTDATIAPLRDRAWRVLIIVQNLPVPFDRRVWLECKTLTLAGYEVAVVCPKAPGDPTHQVIDDVHLYKYHPFASKGGKAAFLIEYVYSFMATLWLSLRASRGKSFDVVQTCNPPDIFWPIGLLFRALYGSKFVFDHHDLCPELYESRFPNGSSLVHKALLLLERLTVASADHVIATNDSYRSLDIRRHGASPEKVTVVRTGPDPERLKPGLPDASLRRGRSYLAAYIGVMGPQDGVDIVLRVADRVIHRMGRDDISFTLIGSGDCFQDLLALRDELDLASYVEFTGRIPDDAVAAILSTADVGISPDPKNPLNDLSTMNKTMEYMAFGLPVVAFDLTETRVSAAGAAVYATPNEIEEMAALLVSLVDDLMERERMGKEGRQRVEEELAWPHQAARYARVYEDLTNRRQAMALNPSSGA